MEHEKDYEVQPNALKLKRGDTLIVERFGTDEKWSLTVEHVEPHRDEERPHIILGQHLEGLAVKLPKPSDSSAGEER